MCNSLPNTSTIVVGIAGNPLLLDKTDCDILIESCTSPSPQQLHCCYDSKYIINYFLYIVKTALQNCPSSIALVSQESASGKAQLT
jgi:hypothetical protein